MNKSEKIKERARKIIGNAKIETIIKEADMMNIVFYIIESEDINVNKYEIILNQIELYIALKQKLDKKEENFNYLKEISKNLKTQKIRKYDKNTNNRAPLFKVKKDSEYYYFITRKEAQEFIENNKGNITIEIEENQNKKLEELINQIKKDF